MGWRYNPFTGTLDRVGGASSATGTKTEHRTLTAPEAAAKAITLVGTPLIPGEVSLDIISGVPQDNGFDFSVSGTTLTWNGLGLDVTLDTGDKIRISYTT